MANGVDTSEWDCPVEIDELEEKIVADNCECDVCNVEHPAGTTFYGHEESEWDVCEFCYAGKGSNTALEQYRIEHENISMDEMLQRVRKLKVLQAQREKEKDAANKEGPKLFGQPDAGATGGSGASPKVVIDKEDMKYLRDKYRIGGLVQTYFTVLGKKSGTATLGTLRAINDDGTLSVYLDKIDKTQSVRPAWITSMLAEEQEKTLLSPPGSDPKDPLVCQAHFQPGFPCELCEVQCNSWDQLIQHMGARHKGAPMPKKTAGGPIILSKRQVMKDWSKVLDGPEMAWREDYTDQGPGYVLYQEQQIRKKKLAGLAENFKYV